MPNNFAAFEDWLHRRCSQGGQKSHAEMRKHALEVFLKYSEAKKGVIGRTCACGEPGVEVKLIQPVPTWPTEPHVLCKKHAELVAEFDTFCSLILKEGKDKG